ncbi:MAG: hypothetical protein ABWY54_06095 [Glaciihabitans sp.]
MTKIGLSPETVRGHATSIENQLGLLDHAQQSLQTAGLMSANPLNYLLSPGALVLSPWSITQTSMANVEIALARASARELVQKLLYEVGAQEFASSALDGSYETGYAWRTDDAKKIPDLEPGDLFNPLNFAKNLVDNVSTLYGLGETALLAAKRWAEPVFNDFKAWWKALPPWAGKLSKFGKAIPILGSAVSLIDLGIAISEGDVPGIIQHGGSIVIDIVTAALAPTLVGGLIGAGVGILWDAGWEIADDVQVMIENPTAMYEYYQEVPWMAPIHALAPITVEIWGPLAG